MFESLPRVYLNWNPIHHRKDSENIFFSPSLCDQVMDKGNHSSSNSTTQQNREEMMLEIMKNPAIQLMTKNYNKCKAREREFNLAVENGTVDGLNCPVIFDG